MPRTVAVYAGLISPNTSYSISPNGSNVMNYDV
jgi:hypothetical protein